MDKMERARQIYLAAQFAALSLPDEKAAQVPIVFEAWKGGVQYIAGDRRQYGDKLYKCRQAHTSEAHNTPDLIPAIWEVLDVEHAGTIDDPIPAAANMEYFKDKYYIEDNIIYLCTRSTEQPITQLPHELVGIYFDIV